MCIKNICEKSIIKYSNKVKFNILFISAGLPFLSNIRNKSFSFTPINEYDASKERANKRFSAPYIPPPPAPAPTPTHTHPHQLIHSIKVKVLKGITLKKWLA